MSLYMLKTSGIHVENAKSYVMARAEPLGALRQ